MFFTSFEKMIAQVQVDKHYTSLLYLKHNQLTEFRTKRYGLCSTMLTLIIIISF